jgi:hypothetical protein
MLTSFNNGKSNRLVLISPSHLCILMPCVVHFAVVDFRRIWDCEGDSATPCPEGYSIWRPLPPAGYVSVGDCMMKGHDPPPAVCVVQDTSEAERFLVCFCRVSCCSRGGSALLSTYLRRVWLPANCVQCDDISQCLTTVSSLQVLPRA